MSPIQKIRSRERLTKRDLLAILFAMIFVTALVTLYVDWHNSQQAYRSSQEALKLSRDSVLHLRHDRQITEIEFCRALNQGRRISNRDRRTFQRAIRESKRDLKVLTDPVLVAIVKKGIESSRRELHARPHLAVLPCRSLVLHPTGVNIPGLFK